MRSDLIADLRQAAGSSTGPLLNLIREAADALSAAQQAQVPAGLSDDQRLYVNQAVSMLGVYAEECFRSGYDSSGEGAQASAHVLNKMLAPSQPVRPVAPAKGSEVETLRAAQAEAVMPMIGPLLDAWDGVPNDMKTELPELRRWTLRIGAAMENAEPPEQQAEPAPEINLADLAAAVNELDTCAARGMAANAAMWKLAAAARSLVGAVDPHKPHFQGSPQ